jgi:hypothetical protein
LRLPEADDQDTDSFMGALEAGCSLQDDLPALPSLISKAFWYSPWGRV